MAKVSLREHLEMQLRYECRLREADDRRYSEVAHARAEALKIKEAGDAKALELARDIQVYKDEKANELRSQIERERGEYIGRAEFQQVRDFVTTQQGGNKVWNAVLGIALTLTGFAVAWLLRS